MSDDLEFNYSDLRYIELRGNGDKLPLKQWGGYSQDFEEAEEVYTHEEVAESGHESWGVVDIDDLDHGSVSLLIFDLDVHKANDEFDVSELKVPDEAPLVKSQNGGFHVYFAVHEPKGSGKESDFTMTQDLGWGIDIRGSFVKAHVVAPAEIPGVTGPYELKRDTRIPFVFDPADAVERIQYKGESLLDYNPDRGLTGDFDFERPSEPPEDMPKCYHAGLELRKANPDNHPNTHKVNVLTALCGLASGYSCEKVASDFVGEYAPGPNADVRKTEYQVEHLARNLDRGNYSPPSIQTLRDYGIFEQGEECDCEIAYHGGDGGDDGFTPQQMWEWWSDTRENGKLTESSVIPEKALVHVAREHTSYDLTALDEEITDIVELPPKAYNKALWWVNNVWADERLAEEEEATCRKYRARDASIRTWEDIRYLYEDSKEKGRKAARDLLSSQYDFITVSDSETLQVYDEERGIFTDRTGDIRGEIYENLGEHWSTHELNEIVAGLRQQNVIEPHNLNARDREDPLLCVENGVINLLDRSDFREHSPEYHFVNRVPVAYNPNADTSVYEGFVDDLVEREADKKSLFEMVGHALLPDANERYKKFLILTGDADNGKSVFYDCVASLLNGPGGEESNTSGVKLAKLAQNRFSIASMYGAMANIAGEIDGKKIRNTANLKDITGGDEVEIEPKGKDSFFDKINTTLMFAANDPPILGERDKKAIATRIVPIELPNTFVDNPDPNDPYEKQRRPERELHEELKSPQALSGFLSLALDGLERLEENNGDVSLPESPKERLERYERSADPMREFGTIALKNDPEDYLVKADVTTMYKEFASQQGYEVGSSIGSVLHGVLRGIESLNYTDSKPRNPDYTETSLPLKPWDDRKEVIDRVTLTEKGLKLAKSAGLIVEEPKDGENKEPQTQALAASGTGHMKEFTATAASVDAGEYNREAQGTLKGQHGTYIGFVVPGGNNNVLEGKQGETFHFENVTIRTNDDGLLEAVINDATTITRIDNTEQTPPSTKATDGGDALTLQYDEKDDVGDVETPPADATGTLANAQRLRLILQEKGRLSKSALFGYAESYGIDNREKATQALERGQREGLIEAKGGDEFVSI